MWKSFGHETSDKANLSRPQASGLSFSVVPEVPDAFERLRSPSSRTLRFSEIQRDGKRVAARREANRPSALKDRESRIYKQVVRVIVGAPAIVTLIDKRYTRSYGGREQIDIPRALSS
jgi:hypothetical protein